MKKSKMLSGPNLDKEITENIVANEQEKEKKLLNLIAGIIVNATLNELYETGDKISEI